MRTEGGAAQGSYQAQVKAKIVARLGLATLGQVFTPGPISSGQGAVWLRGGADSLGGACVAPQP